MEVMQLCGLWHLDVSVVLICVLKYNKINKSVALQLRSTKTD